MADTGATLPGTGADDATIGTKTWVNPTNIQAEAGYAQVELFDES